MSITKVHEPVIDDEFPINASIHIYCTDPEELLIHLDVLQAQIRKQIHRIYAKEERVDIFGDNCFSGNHHAIIITK